MPCQLSDSLGELENFASIWGRHWPVIADFNQVPDQHVHFTRSLVPELLCEPGKARPAIEQFVSDLSMDSVTDHRGLAAYLSMLTYLALAYRRPYVETDPEKLAAAPVENEHMVGFPDRLSTLWTDTGQRLGIAPVPSLTALLYCNVTCPIADTVPLSHAAAELERFEDLVQHQRARFSAVKIKFCNHANPDDYVLFENFVKIFLYSEMAGNRVYYWAERVLRAFRDDCAPDVVIDNLTAMHKWATEALEQYFEVQDLPQAALARAQFTPNIKLSDRQGAPGVTGVLIPFLDEFFGFTTIPSTYLEKVRQSRPFLLREPANMIEFCQATVPYRRIYSTLPSASQSRMDQLRNELWQTLGNWRSQHRRQVGRFFASGIKSETETPHVANMTRTFMKDMAERMRAFEGEA